MKLFKFLLLLALWLAGSQAEAQLFVKNDTKKVIYVSIAFQDGKAKISKGWFAVHPNSEKLVMQTVPEGKIYYCATYKTKNMNYEWGGEHNFIVNRMASFRVDNRNAEAKMAYNPAFEMAPFAEHQRMGDAKEVIAFVKI